MPRANSNGIELEYDTFGDPSAEPILLIMGLAHQMIHWDEAFCEALGERGHFVVRFDNRDVGKSTLLDEAGIPDIMDVLQRSMAGEPTGAPYLLSDMARDAVGLLDALGLDSAHVAGTSMGGMIAQLIAIEHPTRARTLTSIMSTTGDRALSQPEPGVMALLLTPPPTEREAYLDHGVSLWRTIGSPGFPFNEEEIRAKVGRAYDRSFYPPGSARQMVAVLSSGSRKEALAGVKAPTLVIHGRDDCLIPLAGGEDTAKSVPNAELLIIDGMGHDLPKDAWPTMIDAICANTARAN